MHVHVLVFEFQHACIFFCSSSYLRSKLTSLFPGRCSEGSNDISFWANLPHHAAAPAAHAAAAALLYLPAFPQLCS